MGGTRTRSLQWLVRALVVAYFVLGVGAHWRSADGFASFAHFGRNFAADRLPAVRTLELTEYSGYGYDGQFYAQLAVSPVVTDPEVQRALDNPRYRARRIFLPLVAHVFGGGRVGMVLQVYSLINVAAWLGFAWWLYRRTRLQGWSGTLLWAATLGSMGALESVQLALTDLPATVLIVAAGVAYERNRRWLAASALAAAGLTRETSVLAMSILPLRRDASDSLVARLCRCLVGLGPIAGWLLFLAWRVPTGDSGVHGNFDWPGVALVRHFVLCVKMVAAGESHLRHIFGPLAMIGLGYQACYLLRRAFTDASPWVRMAVPFAVLFWFLGDWVWTGYWAVARACLPMTVAFFLVLPHDRHLPWRVVLTSLCLPHALYRFWPDF